MLKTLVLSKVFFSFSFSVLIIKKEMIKIVSELEQVIKENESLIYKLAYSISASSVEDLYQVGVIGVIKAYENYNPEYGTKFSTYAYSSILGEMRKYIRENKGIKISREMLYLKSRLEKLISLLYQKYKRMPTTDELSVETGIEEWKIIEALNIKNCLKSLDEPLNTDNDITILDTISNTTSNEDYLEIEEMMELLNENEKLIIAERYFNDKSQSEVADIMGYSQAKVSRCEQKILKKLRNYQKTA